MRNELLLTGSGVRERKLLRSDADRDVHGNGDRHSHVNTYRNRDQHRHEHADPNGNQHGDKHADSDRDQYGNQHSDKHGNEHSDAVHAELLRSGLRRV